MSGDGLGVEECVTRAVRYLPEGDEPVVSDGTDEYALLLRRLCSKVREWEQAEEQLEEEHLEFLIHESLIKANDAEDTLAEFHRELRTTLAETPTTRFHITFPLNIREGRSESAPRSIAASRTEIRKIGENEWGSLCEDFESSGVTDSENRSYEKLLENAPKEIVSPRHNAFYAFEVDARDEDVALSILNRGLDVILGKLNFIAVETKLDQTALENLRSLERTLPHVILRPRLYLIQQDEEPQTIRTRNIPQTYSGFRLPNGFNADFESLRIFPVEATTSAIDSDIADAFRALQAGLTATTNENAFLYYWRGIEEITLHDEAASSKDALERILPLVHEYFDLYILESLIDDLAEKRNEIVHSGIESPVYVRDVNLLRRLLFLSIEEMYSLHRAGYSETEILGVLKNGLLDEGQLAKSENNIQKERSEREEKLEEIEGARRWREEKYLTGTTEKIEQRNP